jgi:hypothetical protein
MWPSDPSPARSVSFSSRTLAENSQISTAPESETLDRLIARRLCSWPPAGNRGLNGSLDPDSSPAEAEHRNIGGKGESAAAFRKHLWAVDLLQLSKAAMRRRAGPGVLTAHVPGETSLSLSDISVYGQSPDKKAPHTRVR